MVVEAVPGHGPRVSLVALGKVDTEFGGPGASEIQAPGAAERDEQAAGTPLHRSAAA